MDKEPYKKLLDAFAMELEMQIAKKVEELTKQYRALQMPRSLMFAGAIRALSSSLVHCIAMYEIPLEDRQTIFDFAHAQMAEHFKRNLEDIVKEQTSPRQ